MKPCCRFSWMIVAGLFLFSAQFSAMAQGNQQQAWPDSLVTITVEGTVLIDTTHQNIYFLDVDGDDVAEYKLAFGPDWYVPESGAVRPDEGDFVTVFGALHENATISMVIVFEINGLLWREPIENWWQHQDWCDSLEVITVTGTILVDTTYYYLHFYLDEDGDELPDYFLSFGPPWYEPESGATLPTEGDIVTIEGTVKNNDELVRLVVLKINDQLWRELYGPAPWTGGWIQKEKKKQIASIVPQTHLRGLNFPRVL